MRNVGRDLQYAARVLLRRPGTYLVAILSLALGVGVTSTIFSLVDGMYLRPLPVRDPEGLVWVTIQSPEGRSSSLAWNDFQVIKRTVTAFADSAVQNRRGGQLDSGVEPEMVLVTIVSDNYFPLLGVDQVSPDYFAVMGTRILTGRAFTPADSESAARVALVNETMARRFLGGGRAVEQTIRVDNTDVRIVGIAEDSIIRRLHEEPEPYLYFPYAQLPSSEATFLVETVGAADALLDTVKREIRSSNSEVTVLMSSTLKQQLKDALYGDWLPALLSAMLGALGIAMAAAGLYGVVLQGVNRRFREMGIRMALGAKSGELMALVLRHGLLLAGMGAVAGAVASFGVGRLVSSLLYGVSPYDPWVLMSSLFLVMAMAFCASLYPAWKAARIDPAIVLRAE